LKNKGFKEESMTKVGLDAIGTSTTLESNKSLKRLLLRFERIQQRHYGMKLMAYTLINLRAFCGV
jgi:hypothetical protein